MMPMVHKERLIIFKSSKHSKSNASFPDFQQKFQQPVEKKIASCIANNYFVKEHLCMLRMCQMTTTKWLSCYYTFKVSANIGFWFNQDA